MLESFMRTEYSFSTVEELNDNLQYLDYIDANYEYKEIIVNPDVCYRYQGDFFGLLTEVTNLEPSLFLYTMYINGLKNPYEFDGSPIGILKLAIRPPIPFN